MDIHTALRSLTLDAAYHLRMEETIGSIEPGKQADFLLLEDDPYECLPEHLMHIRVLGTFIDGEKVALD